MTYGARGRSSHTFDITRILKVDIDSLSITYTDAAHAAPRKVTVNVDTVTAAARQLMRAMAESISVYGDGMWESSVTLENMADYVATLLHRLDELASTIFRRLRSICLI